MTNGELSMMTLPCDPVAFTAVWENAETIREVSQRLKISFRDTLAEAKILKEWGVLLDNLDEGNDFSLSRISPSVN
jgi:hypothetical protein